MKKQDIISGMPEGTKILIGTWLAGHELQHLKALQPADITDNADAVKIIGKIKSYYYSGITKGVKIGGALKLKLYDELKRMGYEETELCSLVDKAKDANTAYIQQVVRIYEAKSRAMLEAIDYKQPGAQQQARQIMDTYTLEGVEALKAPRLDLVKTITERRKKPDKQVKMVFGRTSLLKKAGGLRPGQLTTVTAPPSTGKTAFVGQMALEAAKKNKVLFCTNEMSAEEIGERWIANLSYGKISLDTIMGDEEMDKEDLEEYTIAAEELDRIIQSGNLIVIEYESDLARIEEQIELHKPDIVIIDQLTQLKDSRHQFQDTRLRYCHMTSTLKAIATANNTSIVLVVQSNRQAAQTQGPPKMYMHKESASIEEDADRCIALKVPENGYESVNIKEIEVWVMKNRNGRKDFCVNCSFNGAKQLFLEEISEDRYK
jgi:replicative DNA helicase